MGRSVYRSGSTRNSLDSDVEAVDLQLGAAGGRGGGAEAPTVSGRMVCECGRSLGCSWTAANDHDRESEMGDAVTTEYPASDDMEFEDLFAYEDDSYDCDCGQEACAALQRQLNVRVQTLQRYLQVQDAFTRQLLGDVHEAVDSLASESVDLQQLATALWAQYGYLVKLVSTAANCYCQGTHNHTFLEVDGCAGESAYTHPTQAPIIIDVNLRQQFAVARPALGYQRILEILPEIFIGDRKQLRSVVTFLAEQIAESFSEQSLALPPWRGKQGYLARWFPVACRCAGRKKNSGQLTRQALPPGFQLEPQLGEHNAAPRFERASPANTVPTPPLPDVFHHIHSRRVHGGLFAAPLICRG
eukprot:jgi/Chlat1/1900/Chrsp147S02213